MPEKNGREVDIRSLPFEEKAGRFLRLVQVISIAVGKEEEYTLRDLGKQIVQLHSMEEGEEKEEVRGQIHGIYDKLQASTNSKVAGAVFYIVSAETRFF
ncbi:hypothetical protein HYU92_03765 [Candidatus Curtissbacteria bacterium]|nr:hypothetical protein [Candidatus Curtissbacteria bacterium]